jgi:hypothetical protein
MYLAALMRQHLDDRLFASIVAALPPRAAQSARELRVALFQWV